MAESIQFIPNKPPKINGPAIVLTNEVSRLEIGGIPYTMNINESVPAIERLELAKVIYNRIANKLPRYFAFGYANPIRALDKTDPEIERKVITDLYWQCLALCQTGESNILTFHTMPGGGRLPSQSYSNGILDISEEIQKACNWLVYGRDEVFHHDFSPTLLTYVELELKPA